MKETAKPAPRGRQALVPLYGGALRWLLVGGWVLLVPPVPLGTSLPPLSKWSPVSVHDSAEECERVRGAMRAAARNTITRDPGASALQIAAAMGRFEAQCVQHDSAKPAAKPVAPPPAETPAQPPATPPAKP